MSTLRLAPAVQGTRILGIGSTQPERVVTNDDLSKVMDTTDQWIRERVGIVEGRFAEKDESAEDMAVVAGSKALADAGLAPTDVDTVIVATCTSTVPIP